MPECPGWIAVVDDDPSVLKALKRTLRVHEFQPKTFGSAKEFLSSLVEGSPACLIADLQMPDMTGLELHQHLRCSRIEIPTIIITAHPDARVLDRIDSAGVSAVLSKPVG